MKIFSWDLPETTAHPFRVWLAVTIALAPLVALLDIKVVWPYIFQMCFFYAVLVRPVLSFLGYVKPVGLCKIFRRSRR